MTGRTTFGSEELAETSPEAVEEEEVFAENTFSGIVESNGKYNCMFNGIAESTVLYTDSGNYRIDFGDTGNHVMAVKIEGGGFCVVSWSDDNTLALKNCVTKQQYDNLKSENELHEINPGNTDIPLYTSGVRCTEHTEGPVLNLPENYDVLDFSNPSTGPTGSAIRVVDV